jgi:oligosaccharide reducing-end xylanase
LIVFCTWTRIALVSAATKFNPEDQVRTNPPARAIGLLCFGLFVAATSASASTQKPVSSDGSGAFASGHYRNLFLEAGHSQEQIDAKINAAFDQLFHGDPKTQAVYYSTAKNANGPAAYITDVAHHDVRTEGMSYGMMISVQLNKKAEFDALWNWAKTYMYISDPKHPSYGYFSWSCKPDGAPNEETPAPDGEEYFAMSLYFASARWGKYSPAANSCGAEASRRSGNLLPL